MPERDRPRVKLERDSVRGATRESVGERVKGTSGVSVSGALSVSGNDVERLTPRTLLLVVGVIGGIAVNVASVVWLRVMISERVNVVVGV